MAARLTATARLLMWLDTVDQLLVHRGQLHQLYPLERRGRRGVDAFHGGKYVFRYSKVFNATMLGHSTGSTWPRGRGVRAEDIYNNEWHMDDRRHD